MGCNCGKNRAAARQVPTADVKAREAREAEARTRTATRNLGPAPAGTKGVPVMHGTTQSFALQRNGRTETFGSRMERDADLARHGGMPV